MSRPVAPIQPRLLTAEEAAAYLGYKTTEILARIPVKSAPVAQGGAPRWDRVAIDRWLDIRAGLAPESLPDVLADGSQGEADSELQAWRAQRGARRG